VTGRDTRRIVYGLTVLVLMGYAASWGATCAAMGVAREAVRMAHGARP
jgi:hypothetical protein